MSPLLACAGLLFATQLGRFVRNVHLARKTRLPYTFSLFIEYEWAAYIITPILRKIYAHKTDGWPGWARFMIKDWTWEDKRRAHDKYGDVFLVVSAGGLICYVADAQAAIEVASRRSDFVKPPDRYSLIELYGPNVVTSEGRTWGFHRRITSPPFGEANNELVWEETIRQGRLLEGSWSASGSRDLHTDIFSVTLNIISWAAFGVKLDWTDKPVEDDEVPSGHKLGFRKAVSDVIHYIVPILLLPDWLMRVSPWRKGVAARKDFELYMQELIDRERKEPSTNSNLLSAIIRNWSPETEDASGRKRGFTDREVLGNAFIFLLAGHETTANAIIYGLICLALYPEIQEEMHAEVDSVYSRAIAEGRKELTYSVDYPRLTYGLCFMNEIVRAFPGNIVIAKMTTQPQNLETSTSSHELPSGTRIYFNPPGMHYNTKYWPQPYRVDPSRWIEKKLSRTESSEVSAFKPPRGSFLAFSEGGRACLGKKFAQVEYLAFFATILRKYRVALKKDTAAEKRLVEHLIFTKGAGSLTLAPPRDIGLVLVPR